MARPQSLKDFEMRNLQDLRLMNIFQTTCAVYIHREMVKVAEAADKVVKLPAVPALEHSTLSAPFLFIDKKTAASHQAGHLPEC